MDEAIVETLRNLIGGDVAVQPLTDYQAVSRRVLLFRVDAALVRIGKSRLIARATPIDALLGHTTGSILSRGITGAAALSTTCAALVCIH